MPLRVDLFPGRECVLRLAEGLAEKLDLMEGIADPDIDTVPGRE